MLLQLYYCLQSSDFYKEGSWQKSLQITHMAKSFWNFKAINDYHDEKE
jgi:hypothetical protein